MARGFLSGLISSAALGVGAVTVMSLLVPLPVPPEAVSNAPGTQTPSAPAAVSDLDADGRDADLVERAPTPPDANTGADDLSSLADADTQPGALPEVGGATDALAKPQSPAAPAAVEGQSDQAPASANSAAPVAPEEELELSISTEPAQPAAPSVPEVAGAFDAPEVESAPEIDVATDADIDASGDASTPEAPSGAGAVPDASTQTAPTPETQIAALPQTGVTNPDPATPSIGSSPDAPPQTTTPGDAPRQPDIAEPVPTPPAGSAALPAITDEDTELRPTIGTRVIPLTERSNSNTVAVTAAPAIPPIEAYAEPFDNPDAKPLMSIVLIDAEGSLGAEALSEFPYPLTIAVDPSDPAAADKMAAHRASGFEVAILVDLPSAATAQDAEVALDRMFALVPETVAIVEGVGSGVQGNRALSDQVTAIVKDNGRGFVTQDAGFNTVQKLAAREGVPSAVVFRDFDGAGQDPRVMRRFLDQAAFRAGQEGAVIMMGRLQPDTISALLVWGLQDRVNRIAPAPLSAILRDAPVE